jgi:AraC family transcriptional regulator of adaptative response/methylated-DNA-[protein]-cysteine methyltransferase
MVPVWISDLCRYIEDNAGERLTLEQLARHAGRSRWHLQRSFRAAVGQTPHAYAAGVRRRQLQRALRRGQGVAGAIYEAGYGSSSRAYGPTRAAMGMTPGQYRRGGAAVEISYATLPSPLGPLLVAATDRGLCFAQFESSIEDLRREFPNARLRPAAPGTAPGLAQWAQALERHLNGGPAADALPVDLRGTAFQMRVWNFLRTIPAGATTTYGAIARALGQPGATRAVGTACGRNPVAVAIPCHRVLRGDGALGGYYWGLERKRALLASEGVELAQR